MKATCKQIKDKGDESDDDFTSVGFMFEGAEPTKEQIFEFYQDEKTDIEKITSEPFRAIIESVDDIPGAVQSGHYLWPAANALAQHLVDNYHKTGQCCGHKNKIIELGAGCGLAGLIALQVFDAGCLIFTDHDPGTLQRAKDNYKRTMKAMKATNAQDLSTNVYFETLHWGDNDADLGVIQQLLDIGSNAANKKEISDDRFDIIIGSDLVYCTEVVRPLLVSVDHLLSATGGMFLLAQSFPFDDSTEKEIGKVCMDLRFERNILKDDLVLKNVDGVRVQMFNRIT